jgi:hypothetical protein
MATDPRARYVTIPFSVVEDGKSVTHGLRMKLGTAQALGLNSNDFAAGYIKKTVTRNATTRRAYPGGPLIPVARSEQVQAVSIGPTTQGARTNSYFLLKGDGPNKESVIYYSGKREYAIQWLKNHTNIDWTLFGNSMKLLSKRGKTLVLKTAPIA